MTNKSVSHSKKILQKHHGDVRMSPFTDVISHHGHSKVIAKVTGVNVTGDVAMI